MLTIYLTHLILQKIYRCWIVWGNSICVVIVPSFLTFAFLSSLIYLHWLTDFNPWFLAIWTASGTAPLSIIQGQLYSPAWGNRSHAVYDRECSGDRVDRVQDPQGVLGSQDCYLGRPNIGGHSREHTSARHIHTNWIWHGFVFNPIGSPCGFRCNHGCRLWRL